MTTIFSGPRSATGIALPQSSAFEHSDLAIRSLEAVINGRVLLPGDADYDDSRRIRNTGFDRRPAVIVQVASARDVAQAVRFARDFDLRVAVRSGGHSFSGYSVNDGGIVIDLRNLNGVSIDPVTRTAKVGPGVTSAMLGAAAQQHGLALSTGDVSSVGIGGLALGGGIGWMVREQGLTIDNLLSAQVVTAGAEIIRASAYDNADLFWAIRGGGGNFGIVTEFEFRLHEVGTVLAGMLALPLSAAVLRGYEQWAMQAPEAMTTITYVLPAPPAPFVPESLVGEPIVLVMPCYTGDPEEGQRLLDGLRSLATPLFEVIAPMQYPAIYEFTADGTVPTREHSRSMFLDTLPDEVLDAIVEAMPTAGPASMIQLRVLGGRMARVPVSETAFAHRTQPYLLTIIRMWEEGDETAEAAWVEAFFTRVRSFGRGVYSNFTANEQDRISDAYPGETRRRLEQIKRRFDPTNVFAMNLNIEPAHRAGS